MLSLTLSSIQPAVHEEQNPSPNIVRFKISWLRKSDVEPHKRIRILHKYKIDPKNKLGKIKAAQSNPIKVQSP